MANLTQAIDYFRKQLARVSSRRDLAEACRKFYEPDTVLSSFVLKNGDSEILDPYDVMNKLTPIEHYNSSTRTKYDAIVYHWLYRLALDQLIKKTAYDGLKARLGFKQPPDGSSSHADDGTASALTTVGEPHSVSPEPIAGPPFFVANVDDSDTLNIL